MRHVGRWIAIVGSCEDGREAVVRRLAGTLQSAGVAVGGFVQVPRYESAGELLGFDVVCLASGEHVPLARRRRDLDPDLCEWSFSDRGFEAAGEWARRGASEVCFVEAGRLESAEGGHWATIVRSLAERPLTVLAIRRSALTPVALRLPDPADSIELPVDPHEIDRFCARVRRDCVGERTR